MFDSISNKFSEILSKVSGRARLSEENITDAIREIRLALLEADVHYRVVKSFVETVKNKAIGADTIARITPGQQFIKIVYDEMVTLLGGSAPGFTLSGASPFSVMLVGLMGSGKTTTAGKLGVYLSKKNKDILLVAADTRRPAAQKQLSSIGERIDLEVFDGSGTADPVAICRDALSYGTRKGTHMIIFDTAGRLHIDDELMQELIAIKNAVRPSAVLLVADAMGGQDAVRVAESFHKTLGIDGIILTKLDGDARGGAALSMTMVSGAPIRFAGVGEKLDDLMPFDPKRMAGRILGMGDVVTLVEKAQEVTEQKKAEELGRKLQKGNFSLDDFLEQIRAIKKMGSLEGMMKMVPGMGKISGAVNFRDAENELKKIESIINSMTKKERENFTILNGSRRKRIARGSGTRVEDINKLVKQYAMMKKMMKQLSHGGLKNLKMKNFPLPM